MAWRCARRHTRAWYLPLGCAWCHPGAATEALEAVQPLGIAAPTPKRSTTQPIPASRAPPESPMGTRCPPSPPRLQASRSTSSSARGAASRRTSAGASAPSRVQHQLSSNRPMGSSHSRARGDAMASIPSRPPRRMTPAAPTDYPTSPPAAAADTQAPGRRPPDAGCGPVTLSATKDARPAPQLHGFCRSRSRPAATCATRSSAAAWRRCHERGAVSYTHLTLPTKA